ncbi:flagellar hook-associated protein FlgK [Evansella halocellulosilytica]|uniref:flagellar hook-associated protein FlgK n=1 Tax=Evansella halocellulosilytica TaxID=2011013 RepID=UPI000BB76589|nr:flagellar hook-associated protein FlgK [Evansella halocellulosilytica]
MTSTFHGLETLRRAISTQQAAIHTTGHNISNANTPGYSRQRVNFTPTEAYPSPGFNKPNIPGQIGTGVKAGDIQRIRDSFLDMQYRNENNKYGYWSGRHAALEKMEDIMNEPSNDGIANTMDQFWRALQDLSVNPEDSGARSVVRQRGIAVIETFNYTYNSLESIQRDYQNQIGVQQDRINSLTRQINEVNKQIAGLEPHGDLANDLYDQRDLLVDELSQYVNISVEQVSSGGLSKEHAEGKYTIKLLDEAGHDMGVTLVDGRKLEANELHISYDEDTNLVDKIFIANQKALDSVNDIRELSGQSGVKEFTVDEFRSFGELRATIEAYGFMNGDGEEVGLYPEMLHQLDEMVYTFTEEFNNVHSSGWSLSEIEAGEKANGGAGFNFFDFADEFDPENGVKGAAKYLQLDSAIDDLDNIAASATSDGQYFLMEQAGGEDAEPPMVSGQLQATGPLDLEVRFENGAWQYQLNGEGDWTEIDELPLEVNGLTIHMNEAQFEGQEDDVSFTLANIQPGEPASASGDNAFAGDGSNALALANVKDTDLNFGGTTTNVQSFYQGVIGDMAVSTNEAERMERNSETLRGSVEDRRQSVSGVSLDEEMSNLIQFQHAYNAAARNMTVIDEMLDRIINGMGVVGR